MMPTATPPTAGWNHIVFRGSRIKRSRSLSSSFVNATDWDAAGKRRRGAENLSEHGAQRNDPPAREQGRFRLRHAATARIRKIFEEQKSHGQRAYNGNNQAPPSRSYSRIDPCAKSLGQHDERHNRRANERTDQQRHQQKHLLFALLEQRGPPLRWRPPPSRTCLLRLRRHRLSIHAFLVSTNVSCHPTVESFRAIFRWREPTHARWSAIHRCDAALLVPAGAPRGEATTPTRVAGHRAPAYDAHSRALPDGRSIPLRCDVLRPAAPLRSGWSLLRQRAVLES